VSLLDEVAGDDQRRGPHLRLEDRLERKLNRGALSNPNRHAVSCASTCRSVS
jgi:hypothetical protein